MITLPADQMLQRARTALDEGQIGLAEQAARSVVKTVPTYFDGWLTLGRVLSSTLRLEEAGECLDKAESIKAGTIEVAMARLHLSWRRGTDYETIRIADAVLKREPTNIDATIFRGVAERRIGRPDDALKTLQRVARHPAGAVNIAWTLLDKKDPHGAIDALNPHLPNQATFPRPIRANLFHVLGQAREAIGMYEAAFDDYAQARSIVPSRFNPDAMKSGLAMMLEVFSKEFLAGAPRSTNTSERPVFIAAMPRSGTTLLDRIIAAHPQAAGAGESKALRGQTMEWMTPDPAKSWPRNVRDFGQADYDRVARRYLEETNQFGPDALRISDKHLQNWTMVGLALLAFPKAKIVHLERDPADNAISCFERLDAIAIPWAANLEHIATAMQITNRLMAHWKAIFPSSILTVQYESLVQNTETEARRILDFIGLPWDAACLRHHERGSSRATADGRNEKRGVKPPPTLGSEQASKPVSDSSVGRAAKFGAKLDPFRAAFAKPLGI